MNDLKRSEAMAAVDTRTFIQQANDAFAHHDIAFFETNVANDVRWTMVGAPPIVGRAAFLAEIETMEEGPAPDLSITNMVVEDGAAVVEGIMTIEESGLAKTYAYCDVYRLGEPGPGRIREISAYIIELACVPAR